jgi:[acyl-carrier-protein] S-malonyltransferase
MVDAGAVLKGDTAWVFPGQGSQVPGMGRALYDTLPQVRTLYDEADRLLGYALSDICFNGPAETLQQTNHAQPALLVTEIAHLTALWERYGSELARPKFVAGHSLGEYTALIAANALRFEDALALVAERGRLMQQVGSSLGELTGMSAVLGLDPERLAAICEEAGVDLANINAPGQLVISGPVAALEKAANLAKSAGARRVVPLQVSAAFHSRWMRAMSDEFARTVDATPMSDPGIPVVANVSARPSNTAEEIRSLLRRQTYSPVRWIESVEYIVSQRVLTFVEIGPGKVLSGLIKRIAPEADIVSSEELLG